MNVFMSKLENLLKRDSSLARSALSKLLLYIIPFNRPHKFKIENLTETEAHVLLPFIRSNKNHLGTVHACSMATIGEYAAGLVLIKNFSIAENRLIMKKLDIEFFKQAKKRLFARATLGLDQKENIEKELSDIGSTEILMTTLIETDDKVLIAKIQTTWQLKNWKKVSYK